MPEADDDAEPKPLRVPLNEDDELFQRPWMPRQRIRAQAVPDPSIRPWLVIVLPLAVLIMIVLLFTIIMDGGR
jgi:hypothetical protein